MTENIFEISEYTKIETNEVVPSAKQKISLNGDDYKKVNELAKNHGGGYDRTARCYLFDNVENRDAFIAEATELAKNFTPVTKKQSSQVKFEVGTHGDNIPSAKFTSFVPINIYVAVNEVARSHGGGYSKLEKMFLFKTVEERDKFVEEATNINFSDKKDFQAEKTEEKVSGKTQADDDYLNHFVEENMSPAKKVVANMVERYATPEEKWQLKKKHAEYHTKKLTDNLNETLPERLVEIFKDGLKVHCPHGAVEQVEENGKVISRKTNHYSGLNAIILAAEMQEKNYGCASFIDSRAIYAMREKGLEIEEKVISPEYSVVQDSTKIFGMFTNKNGDRILDTREVRNVTQLEGKDVPPEVTVVNPREDFMFEKTLNEVLNKVIEAQKNNVQIDLVEISKQAKQNAFNLCRKQDAEKQKRISDIQNIDLNAKPKTNAAKLQQFCKKSMEAHGENYKGYVVDGVKRFLLSTPNTKLEQMTKIIDAVAPAAVFDTKNNSYSDFVKDAVREDKKFQQYLGEVKNKPARNVGAVR